MKDIYETFEFSYIKEKLAYYALTELGKSYCNNLEMFENEDDLLISLNEIKEAKAYSEKYKAFTMHYHENLVPQIIAIRKGSIGTKEFFYQISFLLENIMIIEEEFKEKENFPILNEIVESLKPLIQVKAKIDKIISPSLDILDSASSKLASIRSKISHLESSVTSLSQSLIEKYHNFLSEGHGAYKNGIFTLMVKTTFKNRISGIVHGISDSGNTVFIQPQELIEVYNDIASAKEEEIQEIQAILKDLSTYIKGFDSDLLNDNLMIAKLDFLFAKVSFGTTYNGEICSLSSTPKINLINAAHPLIDQNKVVRNNFILNKEKMMIITGPNAGGKTVALKAIGLLIIMNQCGLLLPINEGGELSFFKHIYADIGDNQSLLDNLSTFSSHIVNIEYILANVEENDLVIIDELGSGTSPLDGEAIGLGVIDFLLEKKSFSLISSHYEGVKSYALENPEILCASMIFDEKNLSPTYKLLLHVASSSYGIDVAYRLGLDIKVINRARAYIEEKKQNDKEVRLELLNQALSETEKLKIELENKSKELESEKASLKAEIIKEKETRNRLLEEANAEKQKIIKDAKEEVDRIFAEFKNLENKKLHEVIEVKHNLDQQVQTEEEEIYDECECNPGDLIEIIESRSKGKVTSVNGKNVTVLLDNGLTCKVKNNQIRKVEIIKKSKPKVYTPDFVSNMKKVSTECNVIGLTVKEALDVIDKYIDDAVSVHYPQVRIIHGCGTGKLRSGVHEYLKKNQFVSTFRLGGQGEGGVGATVVYFK